MGSQWSGRKIGFASDLSSGTMRTFCGLTPGAHGFSGSSPGSTAAARSSTDACELRPAPTVHVTCRAMTGVSGLSRISSRSAAWNGVGGAQDPQSPRQQPAPESITTAASTRTGWRSRRPGDICSAIVRRGRALVKGSVFSRPARAATVSGDLSQSGLGFAAHD